MCKRTKKFPTVIPKFLFVLVVLLGSAAEAPAPGIIGGNKNKARALAEEVVKIDSETFALNSIRCDLLAPMRGFLNPRSLAHLQNTLTKLGNPQYSRLPYGRK